LEKVDPDVPRSHAVGAATMLLGQGHVLACGEPNATAKPRPAPPGTGKDLISKVGGVDSKDGDFGFYYLFYKF